MSYIVFLHQTTTSSLSLIALTNCLISSFYIKPQQWLCGQWLALIVLYRLSTSNHNTKERVNGAYFIVLYRLSTSNHNLNRSVAWLLPLSYIVFLHQTTTLTHRDFCASVLSYIVFLHQTTTVSGLLTNIDSLSYIVFLHQTTTEGCHHTDATELSYIVFLHQTTTNSIKD